jgi:hypothetical protein
MKTSVLMSRAGKRRVTTWLGITGLALALTLAAPGSTWAGTGGCDDCAPGTRHAGTEYRDAFERAKHLDHLDCAGLSAYAEQMRQCYNQQVLSIYLRPTGAQTTPTGPEPLSPPRPAPAPAPKPGASATIVPSPTPTTPPPDPSAPVASPTR